MVNYQQHCPRCNQDRPLTEFAEDKHYRHGSYCRPCTREYKREWRRAHGIGQRKIKATGPLHGPAKPPSSSYSAVHKQVRSQRGSATAHACQHCSSPAEQWAYNHADPDQNELIGSTSRGHQARYSADPSRYIPLCRPCHARFDARLSGLSSSMRKELGIVKQDRDCVFPGQWGCGHPGVSVLSPPEAADRP